MAAHATQVSLEDQLVNVIQADGVNLLIPMKNPDEFCLVILGSPNNLEPFYEMNTNLHLKVVSRQALPIDIGLVLVEEIFLRETLLKDHKLMPTDNSAGVLRPLSGTKEIVINSQMMR